MKKLPFYFIIFSAFFLNCVGIVHGGQWISAGYNHTVALKGDGTVWAWGMNDYGQLGQSTATSYNSVPAKVDDLLGVAAISTGSRHTVALKGDGTVWAWGRNEYGQLGYSTTPNNYSYVPTKVDVLSGVAAISVGQGGANHTVALKGDGTVWTWGRNDHGQLGYSTTNNDYNSVPVQVSGISGVMATSGGSAHTLALKQDGTVWAWGLNDHGQLGYSTANNSYNSVPAQVSGLSGVVAIAAGHLHSVALKGDGTVWTWGDNDCDALGYSTANNSYNSVPVQVTGLSGVTAIAAGAGQTVALKQDGTLSAWGNDSKGQLGYSTPNSCNNPGFCLSTSCNPVPAPVSNFGGVVAIAAGGLHTAIVKQDGTVWAWGNDSYGQLGDGTINDNTIPVQSNIVLSIPLLYGNFGSGNGISKWDGGTWTQLNGTNPSKMVATGPILYATFTGYGIHEYNGSNWNQIDTYDPTDIVASGNTLFAKFASYGLHQWNGSSWHQINTLTPDNMVAIGTALYAYFNPYGIHKWDGSSWNSITQSNPTSMVASDTTLYATFSGSPGIWKWNGTSWIQLNGTNPSKMVATGSILYATFTGYGEGNGIHEYNGSTWNQLNKTYPTDIVASGNMLFAKFASYGLHQWDGTSWSQINTLTPDSMVVKGSVLYAHFNPYGIHKWDGSSWNSITPSNPTSMVAPAW